MIKVNNKKTINNLAGKTFCANKLQYLFVVVAILLTTVLFTSLFTIVRSLQVSMEESTMRQSGGSAHTCIKGITEEEYEKIKTHDSIKNISYSVILSFAENAELAKFPSEIRYTSGEDNAEGMFSNPTTGRLPQRFYEIAADTTVLKQLGVPAKIGEKVTLEYYVGDKFYVDHFVLSGFWENQTVIPAHMIWLSRDYVEATLKSYTPENPDDIIGKRNVDINFSNSNNLESKIAKVIIDSGYSIEEMDAGVNWAYSNSSSTDFSTIFGGALVVGIIIFCGYLMISNVFYISVAKDTRYYGLLKAIGTTGRQIRLIIRRQAIILCIIGIPLGLVAGYFVAKVLTPTVLSMVSTDVIKISVNPVVFIISALFACVTVFISISKPSRIAAQVSPIEAMRSTDGSSSKGKATKKSGGANIVGMALANVLRNKKKIALVTLSLSLSLVILNAAYSAANSFDMDKYIAKSISSDFMVSNYSYFTAHRQYANQDTLSEDFYNDLSKLDEVESVSNIYFKESVEKVDFSDIPALAENAGISGESLEWVKSEAQTDTQFVHIYGVDDKVFEELKLVEGTVDPQKLKSGNYIIAYVSHRSEIYLPHYKIGDKVSLTTMYGTTKEYEVAAIAKIPFNISIRVSFDITAGYILPSEVFIRDIDCPSPMLSLIDAKDGGDPEIERFLSNYCSNVDPNMQYESKESVMKEFESTKNTFKSVGTVLSVLLAFIGIMNFINTIVTSVTSRKRELAMLQSVGMTNRQTRKMLILEGMLYIILTAVFSLTIGSVIGYSGINLMLSQTDYITLKFTVIPSLICILLFALLAIAVPLATLRAISKKSIVERLREVE